MIAFEMAERVSVPFLENGFAIHRQFTGVQVDLANATAAGRP
ncbi:hypothetical protein WH297_01740 [Ochrobactrum vermis]|uniref:Uncharacterized protein n=1 Tax=Ochrobactrum vermis TaxID=1827297 RepID=A0ABU8P880_9HYPH